MAEPIDLLVHDAHLLTLCGDGVGYRGQGALAVRGCDILEVGDSPALASKYQPAEQIDARGCVVLPGLVDVHMHTRYAILRGVAQDVGHWMQLGLAPFAKHLSASASLAGTRLNVLEALLAGTTTMGDFLRPCEGWAETFVDAGVRACLTPQINALPATGMAGWRVGDLYPLDDDAGEAAIARADEFCQQWHGAGQGRITTMLGPQGADMLTREQLIHVRHLAQSRGLMVHLHLAQGTREIDQMVARYGVRTPAFLDSIGYLDERLLAVHLTEATDEETDLIASRGVRMALCSGSIGIIDGIVPPAVRYRKAGGVVGLGSDQASGNNCNNIFNEMKLTALFNKVKYRDPEVMPAWEVLRMATIDGARALGLSHQIGSLEPGKRADFIVVDLMQPNLLPVLDAPVRTIVPNLVYASTGKEVRDVIIDGKVVVRNRNVLTLDASAICEQAQHEAEQVACAVAADPLHRELTLWRATEAGWM